MQHLKITVPSTPMKPISAAPLSIRCRPRGFLALAVLLTACWACGGSTTHRRKDSKRRRATILKTVNHLDSVIELIESPPATAEQAWGVLAQAQGRAVSEAFYANWEEARRAKDQEHTWKRWSSQWDQMRVGIYRLETQLKPAAHNASRQLGKLLGAAPQATVHLAFVPTNRASSLVLLDGKAVIALNAAALALLPQGSMSREIVRQLAKIPQLQKGQLPNPPSLVSQLFLDGLGTWAVRASEPQLLEAEAVGVTNHAFSQAQGHTRELIEQIRDKLNSTDPAHLDAALHHGDGSWWRPVATRIASFSVLRSLARDGLPSEVLNMPLTRFQKAAASFWRAQGQEASGGGLVETRSAAEEAARARGAKNASCVGSFPGEGQPSSVNIHGQSWTRQGATLRTQLSSKALSLGLIADIKRNDDDTLANLEHFVSEFNAQGISALLIAGDVAETSAGLRDALSILAQVKVPVLVIPGNRESQGRYSKVMQELKAQAPNLIDMSQIRLVDAGPFAVVSLPGYYDPRYVHASDGCLYDPSHVEALAEIAAQAKSPLRILLAHSPPKASGPGAIDYADAGANVGDPAITKLLSKGLFRAGVYANLHEAGGRAAGADLKRRVRPGSWVQAIHLVVGSANAMEWPMLSGRVVHGMAGLLDLRGSELRYRILFAP